MAERPRRAGWCMILPGLGSALRRAIGRVPAELRPPVGAARAVRARPAHSWSRLLLLGLMLVPYLLPSAQARVVQAAPLVVRNEHIAVALDLIDGITLTGITDRVTGHQWVSNSTFLFEFAVDNGTPYQSNHGLAVDGSNLSPDGANLTIDAHATAVPLRFFISLTALPGETAAVLRVQVTNPDVKPIFLRTVLPKVRGLVAPGDPARTLGMIPQEVGGVIPLASGKTLGMPFDIGLGLPRAMNSMEVADIYDPAGGGGLFFADFDGSIEQGLPPLQFNLSSAEVVGFWIADIPAGQSASAPALAIGVHHAGDWHAAVDYFVAHHRASYPTIPAWFRDQGAIYSFSGGGAGGIYLNLPLMNINAGALWTAFERDDGRWNSPLPLSRAGLLPPGANIAAVKRNDRQADVFYVGTDGIVYTSFEVNDGPWSAPIPLTVPNFAPPGAALAAVARNARQEDLFVVGYDGKVWTLFEVNDGAWSAPIALTAPSLAPPGAPLAAVVRNDHQEDLFVVGNDGKLWTLFEVNDGAWSAPIALTNASVAPAGAGVAGVKRNAAQEDVFYVGNDGAVWTVFEGNDAAWSAPIRLTATSFAPAGAALAAVVRNDHQEDVFVVGNDGAVWTVFEVNSGAWSAIRLTAERLAPPAGRLAAVKRNDRQEDVFYVGNDGAIWTIFEVNDGPWAAPIALTAGGALPPGGVAAIARNGRQEDLFSAQTGRLTSFEELPRLLEEAREFGTNVVYLWDYWEGAQTTDPPYWNKGDYKPRADLGGEQAFRNGIRKVHEQGGRVIVYLEPFIIYEQSQIGREQGSQWAGLDANGNPVTPYERNYTMVAPFPDWQEYIVGVGERLVRKTGVGDDGVDGVFLDSWGWQMNWYMKNRAQDRLYRPIDYARGVIDLARRMRSRLQAVRPDAVVLGETTSGPMGRYWDGGVSADFAWHREINLGRITASPVRYGLPQVNFISNGLDLNELHQIYAAGHNLALCCNWPGSFMGDNRPYIKTLVTLRQQYRDALIYGAQAYQPATGSDGIAAYDYRGAQHEIITVANTSTGVAYNGALALRGAGIPSYWRDLLTGAVFTAPADGRLPLTVPAQGLRVLLRTDASGTPIPGGPEGTATPTVAGTVTGTPPGIATATGTAGPGSTPTSTGTAAAGGTATPTRTPAGSVTATGTAAAAGALGNLRFITPVRVVDTRGSAGGPIGVNADGTAVAAAPLSPGATRRLKLSGQTFAGFHFPNDVSGVLVNVTIVQDGPAGGFVVVFPGDVPDAGRPNASTVNPSAAIAHNFWATGIPTSGPQAGQIAVYSTNRLDLILDVVGYYSPGNSASVGNLRFIPPTRVLDTRGEAPGPIGFDAGGSPIAAGPLQPGATRRFRLAGKTFAGTPFPADISGILAHVTLVQGGASGGFVTLLPGDYPDGSSPGTSTVNPGTAIAFNSSALGLPVSGQAAGTFALYSTNQLDVIVDVMGYWAPSNPNAVGALTFINPTRIVDTRGPAFGGPIGFSPDGAAIPAGPFAAGATRRFLLAGKTFPGTGTSFPADVNGILANVTIVQGGPGGGFVTAFPGDVPDTSRPNASTVNPATAIAASFWANGIPTAGTNAGTEAIYSTNPLDVIVDVVAYFR